MAHKAGPIAGKGTLFSNYRWQIAREA